MANQTDKITDVRNAARPNSTTVSSPRSAGGNSLSCDNLAGWPTASKVHFVTYQIDSSSNPIAGTQLDCTGIVSGTTITSFNVIDGNDTGNSTGDIVEMLPTSAWGQDLADALNVAHNRDGTNKSGAAYPLPAITDFTNANHSHANAAGGGQLSGSSALAAGSVNFSNLLATIFSGQLQTQANSGTAGGNIWWVNLGGLKFMWGTTASISGAGAPSFSVTFPAFFSAIQSVSMSITPSANVQTVTALNGVTTGSLSFYMFLSDTPGSGTPAANNVYWLVIGS